MTIEIPLTKGYVALVDDEDGDLAKFKWHASESGTTVYAVRNHCGRTIYMHRVILGRKIGRKLARTELVDHKHHNGVDNRRSEIRLATRADNSRNVRKPRNNTAGYKGVKFAAARRAWIVNIAVDGKKIYAGMYDDIVDAAIAYNHAAKKYFGEFACLNDIPGWESRSLASKRKENSNKTGLRGVQRRGERWVANVYIDGQRRYLGTFDTPEQAHQAYLAAKSAHADKDDTPS